MQQQARDPAIEPEGPGSVLPRNALIGAAVVAGLLIATAPLAELASDGRIESMDLLSDRTEVTGEAWYLGAVSSVNVLLWAVAAGLHLVAGVGLWRRQPSFARALVALGAFTVLLTLDDLFLVHEVVVPWIVGAGEKVTFTAYAGMLLAILVRWHVTLAARPEVRILTVAVVALGASILLDGTGWDLFARRLAEEGLKLFGTLAWALFPAVLIVRSMSEPTAQPIPR